VAVFLLVGPGVAQAEEKVSFSDTVKLLGNEVGANDRFSQWGLDASGDTIVVGADGDDDLGTSAGAAYIFRRQPGEPEVWEQVAKLTADDGAAFDAFGSFVAVSGDTVVVGAYKDDDLGESSGSVYVFERDAGGPGVWGQVARLTAADGTAGDAFGFSVAVSGETIVVGAHDHDDMGSDSGAAFVFERQADETGTWGQVAELTAADGAEGDKFGWSVAASGEMVVAGAYNDDQLGDGAGTAHIFESTLIDPLFTLSGICPGDMTLSGFGFTPRGRVALYAALEEGAEVLGDSACIGTELDITGALLVGESRTEQDGSVVGIRGFSNTLCAVYLQVVDLTSCATSNVEWMQASGSPAISNSTR